METIKHHEYSYIILSIEDGIMYGLYKAGPVFNINIAKQCVKDRLAFAEGKTYPALIDIRNIKSIDKDARDYLGSKEATQQINAAAILMSSYVGKMIATIFLTFNKPSSVPMKLFSDKKDAIKWLKKYA